MSIRCSFTWHCLYLYFDYFNNLYISSHCCDIEGSFLFSSNPSNLKEPFYLSQPSFCVTLSLPSAPLFIITVYSIIQYYYSHSIIQWLCSCANAVGRKVARPFGYCLTFHQRNAYFSGEGCWGPSIIFDISFGEVKRLCLEWVFGFELLNACVWVYSCLWIVMVNWEGRYQGSEIQNLLVMVQYAKGRCCKRSVLPLQ